MNTKHSILTNFLLIYLIGTARKNIALTAPYFLYLLRILVTCNTSRSSNIPIIMPLNINFYLI